MADAGSDFGAGGAEKRALSSRRGGKTIRATSAILVRRRTKVREEPGLDGGAAGASFRPERLIVGGFFGAEPSAIGGIETGKEAEAGFNEVCGGMEAGAVAAFVSGKEGVTLGAVEAREGSFTDAVFRVTSERRTKNTGSRGAAAPAGGFSPGGADAAGGVLGVGGVAAGGTGGAETSGGRGLALKKMSGQGISI
jgi:hypothetical protein